MRIADVVELVGGERFVGFNAYCPTCYGQNPHCLDPKHNGWWDPFVEPVPERPEREQPVQQPQATAKQRENRRQWFWAVVIFAVGFLIVAGIFGGK